MSFSMNLVNTLNRNIGRQKTIQIVNNLIIIKILIFNIEMGDIKRGVNSSICAPGSGNRNFLTSHNRQSFFDRFLNRNPIGLYLPAVIGGAIVRELNKISLHASFKDYFRPD